MKQLNTKKWFFYTLILTVFTFPLSNSLKSIFLTLSSLLILADSEIRLEITALLKKPWFRATFLLFAVLILGCVIGYADWHYKLKYFNKYSKILYLPLLAFAFRDNKTRSFAVDAFLLAMLITFITALVQKLGWMSMRSSLNTDMVFHNRIDTGLFMGFAAYLAALKALKASKNFRIMYAMLMLLFSIYTVCINSSRTGFLVFAVLLIVFTIQQRVLLRKFFPVLLVCSLVFGAIVYQSPSFKQGIQLIIQDVQQFKTGDKNTSIGFRLQFSDYASTLWQQKPLFGYGSGGFSYQFSQDNPIPSWGPKLGDPHNQYWSFVVDYGLLGLIVLFYYFFSIGYACRNLQDNKNMVFALLSVFFVSNFCDSFLLLANGGYFFIIFAAMGLGESLCIKEDAVVEKSLPVIEKTC